MNRLPPAYSPEFKQQTEATRALWKSALIPLFTLLGFIILWGIMAATGMDDPSGLLTTMLWVQGITTLICWVSFSVVIKKRLRGPSMVILIIFFPIIQICVQFAVFFVGCLGVINTTGT
ncbi:hypothetical protein NT6N_05680 [Oceaniferula spumae]|uniref:DUF805 domain-containing protein n=1 Tax=Oceaniferula spumae TaxID=2979115 RepID=A0AAT9FHS3_9BACT